MRKYNKTLINSFMEGTNKKVGNHQLKINSGIAYFLYHGNCILTINTIDNVMIVDNKGYYNSSTTQAINGYIEAIRKYEPIHYYNYDIVDKTYDKKFNKKIKSELDRKFILDYEGYLQLAKINEHKEIC